LQRDDLILLALFLYFFVAAMALFRAKGDIFSSDYGKALVNCYIPTVRNID